MAYFVHSAFRTKPSVWSRAYLIWAKEKILSEHIKDPHTQAIPRAKVCEKSK